MPHRSRNFPKNAALGMWGALLADKGYDGDRFRENLLLSNILPVIPPRSNRKVIRIAAYLNWVFENQDQNGAEARSACKPARRK
ncbi:Transposase IS4 [Sphingobium yanoikuyae]|jgi:hypothetical protein|uniref:Transposase IS4 n=2 Tax=Sphingobium yanoikuyae TaxID=13690 RepID=A0A084E9W3_SPHYA|nr:hypothetical protein [Sphingobium yanoikuyae]KEZ14755.1 Transposase IS4 [Sphingobium yanoikuyae]